LHCLWHSTCIVHCNKFSGLSLSRILIPPYHFLKVHHFLVLLWRENVRDRDRDRVNIADVVAVAVAERLLCDGCAIAVRLLCDGCTMAVRLLCNGCAMAVRKLCNRCAIAVRKLCDCCTATDDERQITISTSVRMSDREVSPARKSKMMTVNFPRLDLTEGRGEREEET